MDVLLQQEGVCATDVGATPTAAMNLKPYDQLSNNHQWMVSLVPPYLSFWAPWSMMMWAKSRRTMIRGRVQLKSKHIWVVCVCEKETVSHQMTAFYYTQSHVDCNHLVWIVHLFIAKHKELATLSWWRWENTVQVPPLGRDVPEAVHYMERGPGSLTWGTFWNIAGIWSKTPPLTVHKNKSQLAFPPGRPQDFKLEISQYAMHQCWTFWFAWRASQILHSDCSSELKQISHICWERRLESKLVEHLCSWNTGTVKCVCLYLHSAHRLHSTQNKSAGESQRPTTWMTGPASTGTGLALGKPVFSPVKLQNNRCIFISLCKPRRTEIKTAGRNKIRH